ncbi:MAG: Fe-S-binding domain-containing protein, partial [Balneolaceae bacterium]
RVMFGPVTHEENKKLIDLNGREISLLIPLILFMVWIGIRPVDFTKYSEGWVDSFITGAETKSVAVLQSSEEAELPDWTSALYGLNLSDSNEIKFAKKEN